MADFSSSNGKLIANKILQYLERAETDLPFRDIFFSVIEEASTTCGDRMALSILHIGINYDLFTIDKSDLKKFADFIIYGPWMMNRLEEIAREKFQTLKNADEIEVYLAYPIGLKDSLNIKIDLENMLFFFHAAYLLKKIWKMQKNQ